MSMIGNQVISTDFPVDYASGNGSTTAFTLSVAPASVNSIDVQISGVSQSPQTYSVSGTTLTFSAAPPSGTNNIVVRHLGIAGIPNTPSAGSVVTTSIADANVTKAKLTGEAIPIGVNQTWQDVSGSRSAGVTYTNSTGRPIMVSVRAQTGTADCSIAVDGVQAAQALQTTATRNFLTVIVPNGSTYIMQPSYSALWSELR